jgi:hypothetical protein
MWRGGLKFGLDPFTPPDYSRGQNFIIGEAVKMIRVLG